MSGKKLPASGAKALSKPKTPTLQKAAPANSPAKPETGKVLPFNPLERKHLGASVAQEMLRQPAVPLGELPKFEGAGVYAIYYEGPHPTYKLLSDANRDELRLPIYVGKAIPEGGRTGVDSGDAKSKLRERLNQHANSIKKAPSLDIDDFRCRYLVVEDIWIPLGESLLITKFAPVWNTKVAGFGNHQPGSGRDKTTKPRWDQLHPGRSWADKLKDNPDVTAEDIARDAEDHLRAITIPTSPDVEVAPALPEPPPVNMTDEETDV